MRSLCIMVMLCGTSFNTWADGWGDVFNLEDDSSDPGEYNRYLITDWSTFIDNINNGLSTDGYYFKLDNNSITTPIVITEAPESSFDISSDYLDLNDCTFTIGEDGNPVPFPSSFVPLFSDSNLENSSNVTYYFSVTTVDQLSAIASDYSNITTNSNVYFSLGEKITLESVPSDCPYDIDDTYFIFGDNKITIGSIDNPATFISSYTSVFSTDVDSSVEYYYKAENDTWNDFVSYYNNLSNKDNVYLVMTESFELTNTPDYPLDIDNEHFINNDNYKITISDPSWIVFSNDDMNTAYVEGGGGWIVTQDNWGEFISAYNDSQIDSNTHVTFSGEIVISDTDMPSSPISLENFDFEDGCTITIGSIDSPISTFPSSFCALFNDDESESHVKYYFQITGGNWDEAVTFYHGLSNSNNVYLVTTDSEIEIYDFPTNTLVISEENFISSSTFSVGNVSDPVYFVSSFNTLFSNEKLEAKVSYYIQADCYNWNDFVSYYNDLEDANKNRVNLVITADVPLTDFPSAPLDIAEDKYYYGSNSISVGDSYNPVDMSGYMPVFTDNTLNSGVKYCLEITSQEGMTYYLENVSALSSECTIYLNNNSAPVSDWYDYDMSSIDFSGSSATIIVRNESVSILLSDKSATHEPFWASTDDDSYGSITYFYTPSYKLVDILFNGAYTDKDKRGIFFTEHENEDGHSIDVLSNFVDHGTSQATPYLIYNYEMLKKLVELINGGLNTEGMYIQLASDINAQGNERFTDIDGSIMLDDFEEETIQFNNFKGSFDGNKHSIAGLTQPLFANLDGATIENLGIVDCNMGNSTPALATSASNTTVTKSYVSGVSNGLIPASGITAKNCYAFNPQAYANRTDKKVKLATAETDGYKAYNITEGTGDGEVTLVNDLSGTHKVIKNNCYNLATDVYSDCTLFIPEDNTFYEVSPSNDIFKWDTSDSEDQDTYIYYVNLGSGFVWIDNPIKSNVSMLHNVLYRDGWLNNNTDGYAYNNVGSLRSLDYLYSWYIVDKKNCDVSNLKKYDNSSNELGMCCRVNNIYYSRNNASTTSPSPDGLNTIYLPFAWNPTIDVYDSDGNPMGDDVEVYILADKLTSDNKFSDSELYKDYSKEKSLLFFDPANKIDATHTTKYDNFAGVSNALPTLLNIPSGESGWYIKRSGLANYFAPRGDGGSYDKEAADAAGLDNLYNNYWEDQDNGSADNQKIGRSFMEIDRLGTDWEDWGESSGSYSDYTYTRHYTCESGFSDCDTKKQIYKTDEDKTVGIIDNGGSTSDYDIYKANEAGDIAVSGGDKQLKIYQVVTTVNGFERPLTIYQADENGDIAYDAETSDPVLQYYTTESDIIHLDDDGYPSIIYVGEQEINVLSIESDYMTGEVVSGEGDLQGKVYIKDESSSNYPVVIDPVETSSNDWIILDNNGYPNKIMINYSSSPVEIDITRDGSSMTGKVHSGSDGTINEGDDVIIEDYNSIYPLSIYVCGGHEEETTGSWSGSDFPGRAYHLGTFKTIGKGNSDITFGAGTYTDTSDNVYSCYKLNSAGTGFAKVTATSTVQPFRTFFAIAPGPDPDADAGAKALSLGFCGIFDVNDIDDTPTQIDDAPVEGIKLMTPNQSRVYSLDGRYVGQYGQKKLARGMYIMNGKKFVVK